MCDDLLSRADDPTLYPRGLRNPQAEKLELVEWATELTALAQNVLTDQPDAAEILREHAGGFAEQCECFADAQAQENEW